MRRYPLAPPHKCVTLFCFSASMLLLRALSTRGSSPVYLTSTLILYNQPNFTRQVMMKFIGDLLKHQQDDKKGSNSSIGKLGERDILPVTFGPSTHHVPARYEYGKSRQLSNGNRRVFLMLLALTFPLELMVTTRQVTRFPSVGVPPDDLKRQRSPRQGCGSFRTKLDCLSETRGQ